MKKAKIREREDGDRMAVDRRQQQDTDAGAAADPVHEADAVGLQRRARAPRAVRMRVAGVNVTVGVRPPLVRVQMDVEEPAPPPHEQPDGERDDDDSDQRLRSFLDALRQIRLEQDERQAEGEERRRVAGAPGAAEPEPLARAAPAFLSAGDAAS